MRYLMLGRADRAFRAAHTHEDHGCGNRLEARKGGKIRIGSRLTVRTVQTELAHEAGTKRPEDQSSGRPLSCCAEGRGRAGPAGPAHRRPHTTLVRRRSQSVQ